MLDAKLETTATVSPSDYLHMITLAMLALETSEHLIAKNSTLTIEQLQQLQSLVQDNEYHDILAKEVQIVVKHANTEAELQAMLHDSYLADDR